ncbi:MAG: thioredoxin domain-containing protein [Syntrophobacteraceae bacterium]
MSPRIIEIRPDKLEIPPFADSRKTNILLLLIALAGLAVSLMSRYHESIVFLRSLCPGACKDTLEIHLLRMPLWLLGAVFYSVVAMLALFRHEMATWIAGPAAGVEALLILLMIQLKAPCVFCMANAAVILLLLMATFRKKFFWQETTLALLFFVGFYSWVPFGNGLSPSTPKTAPGHAMMALGADDFGIAARVGDEVITNQRLNVLLGAQLMERRRDIYRMKMDKLEDLLIEMVLEKEAKQQGKTVDDLVEQITSAGPTKVEESEIDKYIQDNQQQFEEYKGTLPDLRQQIRTFLEQQKKSQVIRDYVHGLGSKYGVRIFVPVPYPPRITIDIQGAPTLGPSNAPVTIVEFSDYECPACRSTHEVVKQIRAIYGDKVRWIYKDYPLRQHKDAFRAAEAAHCAQEQGKFWQYQESLFTAKDLSSANLASNAAQIGMAPDNFSQCLQDSKYKALVVKDRREAVLAGIDRTPSFIINGTLFAGGLSPDNFRNIIDEELRSAVLHPQPMEIAK